MCQTSHKQFNQNYFINFVTHVSNDAYLNRTHLNNMNHLQTRVHFKQATSILKLTYTMDEPA